MAFLSQKSGLNLCPDRDFYMKCFFEFAICEKCILLFSVCVSFAHGAGKIQGNVRWFCGSAKE